MPRLRAIEANSKASSRFRRRHIFERKLKSSSQTTISFRLVQIDGRFKGRDNRLCRAFERRIVKRGFNAVLAEHCGGKNGLQRWIRLHLRGLFTVRPKMIAVCEKYFSHGIGVALSCQRTADDQPPARHGKPQLDRPVETVVANPPVKRPAQQAQRRTELPLSKVDWRRALFSS